MIIRVSMTGEKKEAGKKEKKGVAGYDVGWWNHDEERHEARIMPG